MPANNLFEKIFQRDRSSRVGVLYGQRQLSYGELRDQTIAVSERLNALNVQAGDRVAILLYDSPEFIASFIAIISLGAIAVPINMALSMGEQLSIIEDCGATTVIMENEMPTPLPGSLSETTNCLIVDSGEEVDWRVTLPSEVIETAERRPLTAEFPVRTASDVPAFILYTSGSTGEPKGAVHSQSDIFYTNETYCSEVLRLRDDDRLFSSSRLPFAYGLGNAFTFPLLNGFTTVLCREKPTADVVARVFSDYRPTIFFGVPVVYRMLLDHHRGGGALETSSLRLCVSAGEALPAQIGETWQKTFGVEVLDGIGSTEMLHMFMSNHEGDVRYGSSGKLLKGYEARLVDHEENAVAQGDEGNLWIRGASTARSYWKRPEVSANTFVDGWVRTGDLYRQDADGFWWHMGRSDDCFKPTGQWVSPVEVEGVLLKSDHIQAAAVVEGFDEDGLSCVCAFVVGADGNGSEESIERSLREHCEHALPRFKQPRRYIFVRELPYTATGKVQRFKLRERLKSEIRALGNVQN
jgi:benzoate-CoA ligase